MTEYEQFQRFFRQYGVPHTILKPSLCYDGEALIHGSRYRIEVSETTLWFHEDGRFLGVIGNEFEDWEPREEAPVFRQPLTPAQEAEARANIQSDGYPTWKKSDFLPPPSKQVG